MSTLFWQATRNLIGWHLARAARSVLASRRLHRADGREVRWLKHEIDQWVIEMRREAELLAPFACLEQFTSTGNRLMVESAIFTAAAYRAFLSCGLSEKASRGVTADIGWMVYSKSLWLASVPFRILTRDPGMRVRGTIALLLRFPFNAPGAPGYAVEVRRSGDDVLTHFTHCPPQSFIRSLVAKAGDRGDLEAFYQSWCLYDWPGADVIAGDGARGHYERRQTLSKGDPMCDMCWKAKGTKQA